MLLFIGLLSTGLLSTPLSQKDTTSYCSAVVKEPSWEEVLSSGAKALKHCQNPQEAAKLAAHLASTAFYLGNYALASTYARQVHELAEATADTALLLRSVYLESAIHRALGRYEEAVATAEKALMIYEQHHLKEPLLLGKIYFNLGAAHADNPEGLLKKSF
ncbi:MAG: tetratricopeptide repeat protein [Chlamydiae bacterium]|nr:tetratricopeptide repeat protein [Chlamydiota bacterium]